MLNLFVKHGSQNKNNYRYQFWQHENHPVLLDYYSDSYRDRLNYLHQNPMRASFVTEPQFWQYSSPMDYYDTGKEMHDITMCKEISLLKRIQKILIPCRHRSGDMRQCGIYQVKHYAEVYEETGS